MRSAVVLHPVVVEYADVHAESVYKATEYGPEPVTAMYATTPTPDSTLEHPLCALKHVQ